MKDTVQLIDQLKAKYEALKQEIGQKIVGQDEVINKVLISIFSNGHCLLIGVPGLAKTLLVTAISETLDLKYSRIQFTPDLMPSDIIGTEILDNNREFKFIEGPLFANIILADEINRSPAKVQSALLAGACDYGSRGYPETKTTVLRTGHSESDRAGRYLPSPRSTARPFYVQCYTRLSDSRGRNRHCRKYDRRRVEKTE